MSDSAGIGTNKTQIQATSAALVGVAAGYAAGHYQSLGLSLSDWSTIITALVSVGAVVWPLVVTRAQSLKDTVGKMPQTVVITDAASAAALPENKDVVATTPAITAAIKQAA